MGNKTYIFNSLARDYGNFIAPTFKVKIGNKNLLEDGMAISNVSVDLTSSFEAGGCNFVVANAYDSKGRKFNSEWMNKYFVPGNIVQVEMGYVKTKLVFYGHIVSVNTTFEAGQAPSLAIRCTDAKGAMMSGCISEVKKFKKKSDAVNDILSKYKSKKFIRSIVVHKTPEIKEQILQHLESDYEFVVRTAKDLDYRFYILRDTAYFTKMPTDKKPVIELEWGVNLLSFNRMLNLHMQPKKVIVASHSEMEKVRYYGVAESSYEKAGEGSKTPDKFSKLVNENAVKYVIDTSITSNEKAAEKAKAILNEESMKMVTGNGRSMGIPEIEPGRYIKVSKLGEQVDNSFYITRVTHSVSASGYYTDFEYEVNAV